MEDPTYRKRTGGTGQYTYTGGHGRLCVCGHPLGMHAAERTKHEGKVYQECFAPDYGEDCDCERFAPAQKAKAVKPNAARGLGDRPAMKYLADRFSDEVDPDEVRGRDARGVDNAIDLYERFHQKSPMKLVDLDIDWPTEVVCIGECLSTVYITDKWHKDGKDETYKHVHVDDSSGTEIEYEFGHGVRFYEPARLASASEVEVERGKRVRANTKLKRERVPKQLQAAAIWPIGYHLGNFVRRYDDDETYEINPRGCGLFSIPSGKMLVVIRLATRTAKPEILAMIWGAKLDVIEDGIVG